MKDPLGSAKPNTTSESGKVLEKKKRKKKRQAGHYVEAPRALFSNVEPPFNQLRTRVGWSDYCARQTWQIAQ